MLFLKKIINTYHSYINVIILYIIYVGESKEYNIQLFNLKYNVVLLNNCSYEI